MGSLSHCWSRHSSSMQLHHLSALSSLPNCGAALRLGTFPARKVQSSRPLCVRSKMIIPGFESPEGKAAATLQNYFTYLAVKIVLAQLEEYNPEAYKELKEFADRTPLNDGDKFCATLMRESPRHKGLAMRILEVRSAYASEDFEWDNVQKLAIKNMSESNTALMREFLRETSSME